MKNKFELHQEAEIFSNLSFYAKLMTLFEHTENLSKREVMKALDFYKKQSLDYVSNNSTDDCANNSSKHPK
jgi:hypothetical protein